MSSALFQPPLATRTFCTSTCRQAGRASAMPMNTDKPAWKGYVDVPGVPSGRGEAWLVYRMTPEDALTEKSLTEEAFEPYRARRVISVPFTFEK